MATIRKAGKLGSPGTLGSLGGLGGLGGMGTLGGLGGLGILGILREKKIWEISGDWGRLPLSRPSRFLDPPAF